MPHSLRDRRLLFAILSLVLAILLPIGGIMLAAAMSPPLYRLAAEPESRWKAGQALPGGGRAGVRELVDEDSARAAARKMLASIRSSRASTIGDLSRYRAGDEHGFIFAIGPYLVWAVAPDEATLDRSVAALPFLVKTEARGFLHLLDRYTLVVLAAILAYALVLIFVSSRLLAWAGRRPAPPHRAPLSHADLRAHLLALEFPDVVIHADRADELIFEYAAGGMVERLRMRLDAEAHVVRATASGSVQGPTRQRVGFFKFWWRTMPRGRNSERIADRVQDAGWTWQPVFTFVRLIGG